MCIYTLFFVYSKPRIKADLRRITTETSYLYVHFIQMNIHKSGNLSQNVKMNKYSKKGLTMNNYACIIQP